METMFIINSIALFLLLSYGITLGVKNWLKFLYSILSGRGFLQSNLGKFVDAMFLVGVVYFSTLGYGFIGDLMMKFVK